MPAVAGAEGGWKGGPAGLYGACSFVPAAPPGRDVGMRLLRERVLRCLLQLLPHDAGAAAAAAALASSAGPAAGGPAAGSCAACAAGTSFENTCCRVVGRAPRDGWDPTESRFANEVCASLLMLDLAGPVSPFSRDLFSTDCRGLSEPAACDPAGWVPTEWGSPSALGWGMVDWGPAPAADCMPLTGAAAAAATDPLGGSSAGRLADGPGAGPLGAALGRLAGRPVLMDTCLGGIAAALDASC